MKTRAAMAASLAPMKDVSQAQAQTPAPKHADVNVDHVSAFRGIRTGREAATISRADQARDHSMDRGDRAVPGRAFRLKVENPFQAGV